MHRKFIGYAFWGMGLETQNQTSTYEFVVKRPLPVQMRKFAEMSPEEQEAWSNYISVWTWRAVECLIDLKDFNPSLKAIAKRLNITVEEAVDAVEGLEFLRIIKRVPSGGFIRNFKGVDINPLEIPHKEFLKGHLLLSTELSSRIFDHKNIRIENFVLPANREKLKLFIEKMTQAIKEMALDQDKTAFEEVFAICVSASSLSVPRSDREEA